jgi:hypothetical protein
MSEREVRTLIYDIETSPIIGYTWGVWEQNVIEVLEDWQVLSVAWKWLGESTVHVVGQDDFEDYTPGVNDDYNVIEVIHDLFDEADIVVAHNGDKFDQRKVTARMIYHSMSPPAPYKQIDTKKVASRYAAFSRNSLKFLAENLNEDHKKGSAGGFETWVGCLAGDEKAWKKMKSYNKKDITSLEELYLKLRPWMTNHPNVGRLANKENVCPKCLSDKLQSRGYRSTNTVRYRRMQCQDCYGWCSVRTSDKFDTKTTLVNFT